MDSTSSTGVFNTTISYIFNRCLWTDVSKYFLVTIDQQTSMYFGLNQKVWLPLMNIIWFQGLNLMRNTSVVALFIGYNACHRKEMTMIYMLQQRYGYWWISGWDGIDGNMTNATCSKAIFGIPFPNYWWTCFVLFTDFWFMIPLTFLEYK